MTTNSHKVVLYSRTKCHLCDEAEQVLRKYGLQTEKIDIDDDPLLCKRFGTCVPVIEIDGRIRFRGHINEVLLRRII